MSPAPKNDYERRLIEIVRNHGWQVTSVFDPEGVKPDFSYSIGIWKSLNAPDLIMTGLPKEPAGGIINLYGRRVRDEGRQYKPGEFVSDLIEGYDAFLIDVTNSPLKEEYAKFAGWFYDRGDFPMMQLVWPSIDRGWPWEAGLSGFELEQPLLARPAIQQ